MGGKKKAGSIFSIDFLLYLLWEVSLGGVCVCTLKSCFLFLFWQIPTSSADSFMGYGPVVADGYGCSYNPQPDCVIFCASAFKSCESTSVAGFVRQLSDTLVQVGDMLENRSPPPPPKWKIERAPKVESIRTIFSHFPPNLNCLSIRPSLLVFVLRCCFES